MPSKYSPAQKEKALEMLRIGDDIGLVHFNTGIPKRTLRDWRKRLEEESNCQIAEKTIPTAAADRQSEPKSTNDHDDFVYIRQQLMNYARDMAANLQPDQPDSNRRTLALSRILDRIDKLDRILPEKAKENKSPVWQDAYDDLVSLNMNIHDLIRIEERAKNRDDRVKARLYKIYADQYREKGYIR